jgi:hypothetical protein
MENQFTIDWSTENWKQKMNQVFIVINKKKEKRGGIMIMDPSISLYY